MREAARNLLVTVALLAVVSTTVVFVDAVSAADEVGATVDVLSASTIGFVRDTEERDLGAFCSGDDCPRELGETATLCVAFEERIFVRSPRALTDEVIWSEHGPGMRPVAQFTENHVSEDVSLIQLSDRGRGLRLFFDARDPDAVLAYWCVESPSCVWNVLAIDGERRQGNGADCIHLRPPDPTRLKDAILAKTIEPELRVAATVPSGGIAMVTAGTPNLIQTSSLSAELNMRYASLHGYAFYQYHDVMVPRYMVTWNKVRVLMDMLKRTTHEWVMWMDTDAVVTNRSIILEDIIKGAESMKDASQDTVDLIVCNDIGGWELNTGVMLWRNTEWSRRLLDELWAMEHLPHMRGAEQGQLIQLLKRDDPMRRRHHIFDQTVFNTHPKVHHDGLFIIHMMGFSEKERVTRFAEYQMKLDR